MKPIPVLLAACLLAACASDPLVQTDRDPAVDFQHFHSYGWKQEPAIGNPLLKQRVVDAIDAELAARGWRRLPEAQAELLLVANVSTREDVALNYYYEGNAWSGWDYRPGGVNTGMHRMEQRSYRVGTLMLDLFDASTRRAVWHASAEGTVPASDEHRSKDALAAVHDMFVAFPEAGAP